MPCKFHRTTISTVSESTSCINVTLIACNDSDIDNDNHDDNDYDDNDKDN